VKRAESEQIVAAMPECGIGHEYAMFENEGQTSGLGAAEEPSSTLGLFVR
jgi:hypothetical protein